MNDESKEQLAEYHNPATGYKWRMVEARGEKWTVPRRIKVIESPGVYLVGFTTLHEQNVNSFLRDHQINTFSPWGECGRNERGSDSELLVELAGRLCYMSYDRPRPGGLSAFLNRLKSEGHGSVLEHPHYSFILTGVSRNMTLEANRHRPFSISQLSGRFVDAGEVGFVRDPDIPEIELVEWAGRCVTAFDAYESAYNRSYTAREGKWKTANPDGTFTKEEERKVIKKARERARDILPGCLETRILYTVNTRAIRFVFEKRCHADAAFEIRRCFNRVYRALQQHDPKLFEDYTETPLEDGTFAVTSDYPKV